MRLFGPVDFGLEQSAFAGKTPNKVICLRLPVNNVGYDLRPGAP
jgi:hypothetical protein